MLNAITHTSARKKSRIAIIIGPANHWKSYLNTFCIFLQSHYAGSWSDSEIVRLSSTNCEEVITILKQGHDHALLVFSGHCVTTENHLEVLLELSDRLVPISALICYCHRMTVIVEDLKTPVSLTKYKSELRKLALEEQKYNKTFWMKNLLKSSPGKYIIASARTSANCGNTSRSLLAAIVEMSLYWIKAGNGTDYLDLKFLFEMCRIRKSVQLDYRGQLTSPVYPPFVVRF